MLKSNFFSLQNIFAFKNTELGKCFTYSNFFDHFRFKDKCVLYFFWRTQRYLNQEIICIDHFLGKIYIWLATLKFTSVVILTNNSTALEYTTTKKYHQTTSLYLDQPPSYEYPPTYEEARIIKKYYKFTLVGQ